MSLGMSRQLPWLKGSMNVKPRREAEEEFARARYVLDLTFNGCDHDAVSIAISFDEIGAFLWYQCDGCGVAAGINV